MTVVDGKGFTVQITDSNGQSYTGSVTVDYLAVTAGVYQDAEGKSSVQAGKVIIPAPSESHTREERSEWTQLRVSAR